MAETARKALQSNVPALEYLNRRGISADTAKAAALGLIQHPSIGLAITIPYANGVIKIAARCLQNPSGDKFRAISTDHLQNLLYGIDMVEDEVFGTISEVHVIESELDSLTMRQAGFPTISVSSATTCLEKDELRIFPAHMEILQRAERVFIWTDQDEAGQEMRGGF